MRDGLPAVCWQTHQGHCVHSASPSYSDFVAQLQPQLLRFFMRRVGNTDAAHDLCQETWLRVTEQQGLTRWNCEERARAYVFTIAEHLWIDMLRRRGVESSAMQDMGIRIDGKIHTDVADHLSYRQAIHVVDTVLQELPERKRNAFIRHRLHGEKQDGIAALFGVSTNTIERDIMQVDALLEDALSRWGGHALAGAQAGHSQALTPKAARRRRSLSAMLGLALLAGTSVPAWRLWQQRVQWQVQLASQVGHGLTETLPDGSQLQLDADSRVALHYRKHLRFALLQQGAAFFSVQADAQRPFIVEAGQLQVRVVGTRFSVGLEPAAIVVEVEEGSVQVAPNAEHADAAHAAPVALRAGRVLRAPRQSHSMQDWHITSTQTPAAWRQGDLVFERERLGDVAARLQRYSTQRIYVDAPVAPLPISGRVQIRNARNWLSNLGRVLPIAVHEQADGSLRVQARS